MVLSARAKRQARVVSLPVNDPPARQKRKKFRLKGPGLVLLLLVVFAVYSFVGQMVESLNVQKEVQNMQVEIEQLKKKNEELRGQVKKLESEAWIERAAREKLGLVKPGEKLIMEVTPTQSTRAVADDRESIEVH